MALPTPAQQDSAVKALLPAAQAQLSILGFTIDASQLAAVLEVAVDSMCMKAWKQAHAAGQAAAAAITTPADAEKALDQP